MITCRPLIPLLFKLIVDLSSLESDLSAAMSRPSTAASPLSACYRRRFVARARPVPPPSGQCRHSRLCPPPDKEEDLRTRRVKMRTWLPLCMPPAASAFIAVSTSTDGSVGKLDLRTQSRLHPAVPAPARPHRRYLALQERRRRRPPSRIPVPVDVAGGRTLERTWAAAARRQGAGACVCC